MSSSSLSSTPAKPFSSQDLELSPDEFDAMEAETLQTRKRKKGEDDQRAFKLREVTTRATSDHPSVPSSTGLSVSGSSIDMASGFRPRHKNKKKREKISLQEPGVFEIKPAAGPLTEDYPNVFCIIALPCNCRLLSCVLSHPAMFHQTNRVLLFEGTSSGTNPNACLSRQSQTPNEEIIGRENGLPSDTFFRPASIFGCRVNTSLLRNQEVFYGTNSIHKSFFMRWNCIVEEIQRGYSNRETFDSFDHFSPGDVLDQVPENVGKICKCLQHLKSVVFLAGPDIEPRDKQGRKEEVKRFLVLPLFNDKLGSEDDYSIIRLQDEDTLRECFQKRIPHDSNVCSFDVRSLPLNFLKLE